MHSPGRRKKGTLKKENKGWRKKSNKKRDWQPKKRKKKM